MLTLLSNNFCCFTVLLVKVNWLSLVIQCTNAFYISRAKFMHAVIWHYNMAKLTQLVSKQISGLRREHFPNWRNRLQIMRHVMNAAAAAAAGVWIARREVLEIWTRGFASASAAKQLSSRRTGQKEPRFLRVHYELWKIKACALLGTSLISLGTWPSAGRPARLAPWRIPLSSG